jgi:exosortase A
LAISHAIGQEARTISSQSELFKKQWLWAAIILVPAIVLICLVLRGTVASLVETWSSDATFSHGFLILPIALAIIWSRRRRLWSVPIVPNYWGLTLLAIFGVAWLFGYLGSIRIVQHFALIAILDAVVLTVMGVAAARALLFPLLFLFFCVPFGDSLVSPLQDITARFAVFALQLSRIPVLLEGRLITVPSGTWKVAEACSGVRYLIASLVLGTYLCYSVFHSWRRRLALMVSCAGIAVVANGLRAYVIILLGQFTDNRLAHGVDHIIYGWIFFTAITAIVIFLALRWSDLKRDAQPTARVVRQELNRNGQSVTAKRLVLPAMLPIMVVACFASAAAWSDRVLEAKLEAHFPVSPPWVAISGAEQGWMPKSGNSLSQVLGRYSTGSKTADLFIAYYSAHTGIQIVEGWNLVSDRRRWTGDKIERIRIRVGRHYLTINQAVIRSGTVERLVWCWYWVGGEFTGDPIRAKYLQARGRLLGRSAPVAQISVATDFAEDTSETAATLENFVLHTPVNSP